MDLNNILYESPVTNSVRHELMVNFAPMIARVQVVLIIGMKLQHVIATLALEHSGVNGPFVGVLLKPRDQLFWFNRPKFLMFIIHFILFEVSEIEVGLHATIFKSNFQVSDRPVVRDSYLVKTYSDNIT